MANSIGSLYIDITARTAQLETDMAKVKKIVGDTGEVTKKAGQEAASAFKSFQLFNSFQGRGMTGITLDMFAFMMAVQAVKKEIEYVITNIEKIPGMPAEAIASVNEFKINIKEARNQVDIWIANGITGFSNFAKAVGTTAAAIVDGTAIDVPQATLDSLDKIKEASDPNYWDKVRAANVKLSEARKADAVAAMTVADRIVELRKQSEAYTVHARAASTDSLQRAEDQTKAYQKLTEADRLHIELKTKYDTELRRMSAEEIRDTFTELSQKDKILELNRLIGKELVDTAVMRAHLAGSGPLAPLTDAQMDKANKAFPQLISHMGMLRAEMSKIKSVSMEWRDSFVSVFSNLDQQLTSLVTGGKLKISDFLKSISDMIVTTFFRLAVVNPILNNMFGSTKGFQILPAFFGSGKADGGPASGLTLVGERGPELVNLSSGSTVIPNHQLSSGAGRGGNVYYVDARGADQARIDELQRSLMVLNATFERRAWASMTNIKNRRGAMAG